MLQTENLEKFFDWLLDRRFFPKYYGDSSKRFLPKIEREIQHLKKLQAEGCPSITSTVEELEKARALVATMGPVFRSQFASFSGGHSRRKDVEVVRRLSVATCVARALWLERSPNKAVREKLKSNGYTSTENIAERTLEQRVRRFDQTAKPAERLFVVRCQYSDFKGFSAWPETQKALGGGIHWRSRKDQQRIARLMGVSVRESGMLQKLFETSEKRRNEAAKNRKGFTATRNATKASQPKSIAH